MFKGIVETFVNVDIMGMYEYLHIIDLHVYKLATDPPSPRCLHFETADLQVPYTGTSRPHLSSVTQNRVATY